MMTTSPVVTADTPENPANLPATARAPYRDFDRTVADLEKCWRICMRCWAGFWRADRLRNPARAAEFLQGAIAARNKSRTVPGELLNHFDTRRRV